VVVIGGVGRFFPDGGDRFVAGGGEKDAQDVRGVGERTDLFETELQNVADGVQARHEYVMVVVVKEKKESLPQASPSLARPTRTNQAAWTTISRLARSHPGTCRYRWIHTRDIGFGGASEGQGFDSPLALVRPIDLCEVIHPLRLKQEA
jgi:hypothetical protein